MASTYPATADTFVDPPAALSGVTLRDGQHPRIELDQNNALRAIQAALGTHPQATPLLRYVPVYIHQNADGSWPLLSTYTTDELRLAYWVKWVPASADPQIGSGYMRNATGSAPTTDFVLALV